MDRMGACQESRDWVLETAGSVRDLWKKCPNGGWMEDLVFVLALYGGGKKRERAWEEYIFETAISSPTFKSLKDVADCLRKCVPWHMVDKAIQREGSK